MSSTDPLRDLERRVDALAAKVDLSDAGIRSDIEAIRRDVDRLREDTDTASERFVHRTAFDPVARIVWTTVGALIVGLVGALVAIATRQ